MPHIQYGILCWGHKSSRIFNLQKRAMRLITNSKYNAHSEPLYKKLKCLTVPDTFTLKMLKFHYNIEKGTIPHYFVNMFKQTSAPPDHNTRFRHLAVKPTSKTTTGSDCLRYLLPETLLNTPSIIKEKVSTHSAQGFSNYIKQYFINKYADTCSIQNCYICNQS